jgi:hypothetical protein
MGFSQAGNVKDVCNTIKAFADKHKGKTVYQAMRYERLVEVEREQFREGTKYDTNKNE